MMNDLEGRFLPQGHHVRARFHEVSDPSVCIAKKDLKEGISTKGDLVFSFPPASSPGELRISIVPIGYANNALALNKIYAL